MVSLTIFHPASSNRLRALRSNLNSPDVLPSNLDHVWDYFAFLTETERKLNIERRSLDNACEFACDVFPRLLSVLDELRVLSERLLAIVADRLKRVKEWTMNHKLEVIAEFAMHLTAIEPTVTSLALVVETEEEWSASTVEAVVSQGRDVLGASPRIEELFKTIEAAGLMPEVTQDIVAQHARFETLCVFLECKFDRYQSFWNEMRNLAERVPQVEPAQEEVMQPMYWEQDAAGDAAQPQQDATGNDTQTRMGRIIQWFAEPLYVVCRWAFKTA
jgi:RNAse (barnase) inhibitor barstar